MELQSIETKKSKPLKWILIVGCICILIWVLIFLCAALLLFTTGDSNQQLPDFYEKNQYTYEQATEPYWLAYPADLQDFSVDKDFLEAEGEELGVDFYQEVMESDAESLLQ